MDRDILNELVKRFRGSFMGGMWGEGPGQQWGFSTYSTRKAVWGTCSTPHSPRYCI